MAKRLTLSNLLLFSIALLLTSCTNSGINSVEQLVEHDEIISYEAIEVNADYLVVLEEYFNDIRDEWSAYSDLGELDSEGLIPADELLCYRIRYKSDEEEVVGYVSLPVNYKDVRYPVLIDNRGGIEESGSIQVEYLQHYARYGYIVLASQYRGVDGGTGFDEFGGEDVNDVIKLIDMAEMINFSNGKIYMFGWSRGAMQTYIVLGRDDRIDAAVAGAGPTDLIQYYDERNLMRSLIQIRIGTNTEENQEEYIKRSAVYWPEKINTPLLIAHGTEDEKVLVRHSIDLYEAMVELDKDVEIRIYEGMDHSDSFTAFIGDYLQWLKNY